MTAKRDFLPLLFTLVLPATALADDPVDYARDIKPLLTRKCYSCHGPLKQRAELRLDTVKNILKGSENGAVVVAGRADKSLLIAAVIGKGDLRMPPQDKPLSVAEVDLLRNWINEGAKGPADEIEVAVAGKHWSFQASKRPEIPRVKNPGWVRNPIDAFIAAEHDKRGLMPNPPAAKEILLRRVYLDLIGVPPTREEIQAFLADEAADAYEKVVDKLLASPQYGERWGRHWMDVWRYSDWYGRRGSNEIRYSQYHIWRWRDWIIESVNEDKGYDRMIVEMLAGDEIAPEDPEILRATGFLGRNWYKFDRNVWLRETVEHTASGFLGLTLKCARCHDHKYDPILQRDYYQFWAFFEPHDVRLDPVSGETNLQKEGLARVFDSRFQMPTFLFERGDDRFPDKDHPLQPGVPASLGKGALDLKAIDLPVHAYYPALRPEVTAAAVKDVEAKIKAAREEEQKAKGASLAAKKLAAAEAELASLRSRIAAEQARYATPADPQAKPLADLASGAEREFNLRKAELALMEAEIERQAAKDAKAIEASDKKLSTARQTLQSAQNALKLATGTYSPLGPQYPRTSTGRRLALAKWIADAENPRTARVAVNHIWARHFGSGIVPTLANFGLAGKAPTHQELLDWLAVEFVSPSPQPSPAGGEGVKGSPSPQPSPTGGEGEKKAWSMKHIHRLIVTSNTYRLSSTVTAGPNLAADPNNVYLWRANSKRMEAEVVRDSLLHLAGNLDLTMGGPELPQNLGQTSKRKSVYFRLTPDDKMELLELFDLANPNECYDRPESVVPQQALALMNSALAQTQSRLLARKLSANIGDKASATDFIRAAFEQVLGRQPTHLEAERCEQFLQEQVDLLKNASKLAPLDGTNNGAVPPSADPMMRARENLVLVLFNHNDFVTIR
jgi:hypothetical protein